MPAPSAMRPVDRGADAALAVRERLGDAQLEAAGVGAGADRRAAEGAVGELDADAAGAGRVVDGARRRARRARCGVVVRRRAASTARAATASASASAEIARASGDAGRAGTAAMQA